MIAIAKLVLFVTIWCQAYVGSVRMSVTLLSHTFEGSLYPIYPPGSLNSRFKDCIINDLLNGIQIQDISRRNSLYTTYRDGSIKNVHLNISVSDLIPEATIDCYDVLLNEVILVCQANVTTADSYIAMIPLLNVWTTNDCRFIFRYSSGPAKKRLESLGVGPPAPSSTSKELTSRNNSESTELLTAPGNTQSATIIGLAIGLIVLIVVFAVFVYIIRDKIKLLTTEKQPAEGFCIADHSDVINKNKHGAPCSTHVYRTPYGEWDTEGENGHRHRDMYALPVIEDNYSCRPYATPDIIKEQLHAEGDINQHDYIEIIDHYSSISKKT